MPNLQIPQLHASGCGLQICNEFQLIISMKLVLLILLPILIQLSHSQYCTAQYSFENSGYGCVFQYDYSNINCTDFNLVKCIWTECVEWVRVGNRTQCHRTQTFNSSNWNACTQKCCDDSFVYPYDFTSISNCQDYLNSVHTLVLVIVFSIFGGIIIIMITFFFKKHISKNYRQGECQESLNRLFCFCCLLVKRNSNARKERKARKARREEEDHSLRSSLLSEPDPSYYAAQSPSPK